MYNMIHIAYMVDKKSILFHRKCSKRFRTSEFQAGNETYLIDRSPLKLDQEQFYSLQANYTDFCPKKKVVLFFVF